MKRTLIILLALVLSLPVAMADSTKIQLTEPAGYADGMAVEMDMPVTDVDFEQLPEIDIPALDVGADNEIEDEQPEVSAQDNAFAAVSINKTNFPDDIFREYVADNFDKNNNKKLSKAEIEEVDRIYVSGMGVTNLKGIEHFTALQVLYCGHNPLKNLNVTKNKQLIHRSILPFL